MASQSFTAQAREVQGKKVATLRRAGITPANIYGHNVPSLAVQVDTHDFGLLLRRVGRTGLISLQIDGEREPRAVLVRDVQRKATTGDLVHIDFIQVSMREQLHVTVPVVLTGHAPVLDTADCTITQALDQVEISCLPSDIPAHLDADLAAMTDTTSVLHVRDLALPASVTLLTDPDIVVAGVTLSRAAEEEEPAEAVAADEVPTVENEGAAETTEE